MTSQASDKDLEYGFFCEQPAATVLAEALFPGSYVEPRDTFSAIDANVMLGTQPVAFIEVKRRRVKHDAYDTTAVHWSKYIAARNFLQYYGVRTYCLVIFEDRVGWFYLDEKPDRKEMIARKDRDGVEYPHAMYGLDRMVWRDDLMEAMNEAAAAAASAQ